MECIKEYKRHGAHYFAGKEYDISPEKAAADEAYMGGKLWKGGSAKPAEKKTAKKPSKKK